MGGVVSFLCFIFAHLYSSCFSLLQSRVLPQGTALHKLLHRVSFPWAAVLQKLLQHDSCPEGAILQEPMAPVWVPCGVTGTEFRTQNFVLNPFWIYSGMMDSSLLFGKDGLFNTKFCSWSESRRRAMQPFLITLLNASFPLLYSEYIQRYCSLFQITTIFCKAFLCRAYFEFRNKEEAPPVERYVHAVISRIETGFLNVVFCGSNLKGRIYIRIH